MNARKVQDQLRDMLETANSARHDRAGRLDQYIECIRQIATYENVGMLAHDRELLIDYQDRSEHQLTIVKSRPSKHDDGDDS